MAQPPKILVAGGPQFVQSLASVVAANGGYQVLTAGSIAEAEARSEIDPPTVAVLAYSLKDGDATAACPKMSAAGVPVLVVLPSWSEERRDASAASGASDVIGAPIKRSDVARRLRRLSGLEVEAEQATALGGWCSAGAGWIEASVVALSAGSARLVVNGEPDPVGMRLSVGIPGGDLVLWARPVGAPAAGADGRSELRVEFVGLSETERAELERALATLRAETPAPAPDQALAVQAAEAALGQVGAGERSSPAPAAQSREQAAQQPLASEALEDKAPEPEPVPVPVEQLPDGAFIAEPVESLPEALIPEAAALPTDVLFEAAPAESGLAPPAEASVVSWPQQGDPMLPELALSAIAAGHALPDSPPPDLVQKQWDGYSDTEKAAFTKARPTPASLRRGLAAQLTLRTIAAEAKDLHPGMVMVDHDIITSIGDTVDATLSAIQRDIESHEADQAVAAALFGLKTSLRREWAELREASARLSGTSMADTMAGLAEATLAQDVVAPVRYTPRQAASAAAKPIALPKITAPEVPGERRPLVWITALMAVAALGFHGYRIFLARAPTQEVKVTGFPEILKVQMDGVRAEVKLRYDGLPQAMDLDRLSKALADQGAHEVIVVDNRGQPLAILGAGGQKEIFVQEMIAPEEPELPAVPVPAKEQKVPQAGEPPAGP